MARRSPPPPADRQRLLALVDNFADTPVAVFGDLIVDEFIYGQISRVRAKRLY